MTDRFARTDGSTTSPCNTTAGLYCGGTWRGTLNHLDYIQGMGFDAVMISPIVENVHGRVEYGEAYHGYWPLNFNALNSRFGSHQDLLDLSEALHARGMYLMMDTVINNMAYITNGSDPGAHIDYSVFTPFNSSDYFHPYCKITNWDNMTNAQLCQTGDLIVPLPDLFTEHKEVQDLLIEWVSHAITTYSIDGLRIDAAKHVTPSFLLKFFQGVDTFMTGEVFEGAIHTISDYQRDYIASMPNYPIYFEILSAFTQGNTSVLATEVEKMRMSLPDTNAMTSFSENHDRPRISSYSRDMAMAKNVLVFTMLFDGIPMVYQGQEQHLDGDGTPNNREAIWLTKYDTGAPLYKLIGKLNRIRKHAYSLEEDYLALSTHTIFQGGSELAFMKGVEGQQVMMVLSTQNSTSQHYSLHLPFSYNAGTTVTDVLNCNNYTVDDDGVLEIDMDKGEPRVFFPTRHMNGSGLCGYDVPHNSFQSANSTSDATSPFLGITHVKEAGLTLFILAVTNMFRLLF